jgi:hypothetical protein
MKIVDLKKDMDAQFAGVDARFEVMRRHIDIWGEQLRTEMRLYFEESAAMLQRLDAHLAKSAQDHANFMRIFEIMKPESTLSNRNQNSRDC